MSRWALVLLCGLLLAGLADAHGGRTNSAGCHNQKSNGTYHCHNSSGSSASSRPSANSDASQVKRSSAERSKFVRNNPCPATGKTSGSCPGWHVDHIIPLACGGADKPYNMQWLTATENLKKGSMGCRY